MCMTIMLIPNDVYNNTYVADFAERILWAFLSPSDIISFSMFILSYIVVYC